MPRSILAAACFGSILLLSTACGAGSGPAASPSSTPTPSSTVFNVVGSITVPLDAEIDEQVGDDAGNSCVSDGGYDDISRGAQVEVQDGSGTTIALGSLQSGVKEDGKCSFVFVVADVPEGNNIYGVKVGNTNRGVLKYERARLNDPVVLTLG